MAASPLILYSNNAKTTLAAPLTPSSTTISLASGSGNAFPVPVLFGRFFYLTLCDFATQSIYEIVRVNARSGDTLSVVRGQQGTNSLNWATGDFCFDAITAGGLQALDGGRLLGEGQITYADTVALGTPGSWSYLLPPAGCNRARMALQAGGGGGGGVPGIGAGPTNLGAAAGGGGSGGRVIFDIDLTGSTSQPALLLIIGVGGLGGAPGYNVGLNGQDTFVSGYAAARAFGGVGGSSSNTALPVIALPGGAGGGALGGIYNMTGTYGLAGWYNVSLVSGAGASSPDGGGGQAAGGGVAGAGSNGFDATGWGAGGSGAASASTGGGSPGYTGGGGLGGKVKYEWWTS